jgi:hypothetical protein
MHPPGDARDDAAVARGKRGQTGVQEVLREHPDF